MKTARCPHWFQHNSTRWGEYQAEQTVVVLRLKTCIRKASKWNVALVTGYPDLAVFLNFLQRLVLLKLPSHYYRFCQILLNSSLSTGLAPHCGRSQLKVSTGTDIWVEHSRWIYVLHLRTVHFGLIMFKICMKRDLSLIALFLGTTYFRLKPSFTCPPCDVSFYFGMKRHI